MRSPPQRRPLQNLGTVLPGEEGVMSEVTLTLVRERAYEIFLRRGESSGDEVADWLRAEREIREEERGHRGPARMRDVAHHGRLTDHDGCDLENPT